LPCAGDFLLLVLLLPLRARCGDSTSGGAHFPLAVSFLVVITWCNLVARCPCAIHC